MNTRYIIGAIIIIALAAAAYYFGYGMGKGIPGEQATSTPAAQETGDVSNTPPKEDATSGEVVADVGYLCAGKKTIHAVYYKDKVIIELSDGRAAQLPQTVSASGVRYANSNESLVFWSKGPTAFVQEAGKTTYDQCAELDTTGVESGGMEF